MAYSTHTHDNGSICKCDKRAEGRRRRRKRERERSDKVKQSEHICLQCVCVATHNGPKKIEESSEMCYTKGHFTRNYGNSEPEFPYLTSILSPNLFFSFWNQFDFYRAHFAIRFKFISNTQQTNVGNISITQISVNQFQGRFIISPRNFVFARAREHLQCERNYMIVIFFIRHELFVRLLELNAT